MRFKGALSLLAVSLLLGGAYLFYFLPAKKRAAMERELKERIFSLSEDDIDDIRLVNRGQAYEVRKGPEGWTITSPALLPADEKIIRNIAAVMDREKILKVVSTDMGRLGEFGLSRPLIHATFGKGDQSEEFFIGRPSPTGTNAYMYKKGAEGIFLVSLDVPQSLNQDLYGLRKKEPFDFEDAAVRRVTVERAGGKVDLVKGADGVWSFAPPLEGRGSEKAVASLLGYLKTVRADEYFDGRTPEPSDYPDHARVRLGLEGRESAVMDVYFWGTGQDEGLVLYQHGKGHFARTDQRDLWKAVHEGPDYFTYRDLFDFQPGEVQEVELWAGGAASALTRKGGGWASGGSPAPPADAAAFLDSLKGLEAYGLVKRGGSERGEKTFSLILKGAGGKAVASLLVYGEAEKAGGGAYDTERGELKTFYAESSNLKEKVLVTSFMVEDLEKSFNKLAGEVSGK